ncbi:MAG: prolipoprotein diacylglyceryl transferase [Deltaproteobacteria bacterium RIFCSPLOWO2_12_FULL_38_8]|nr:MAG: prolipoprotein diacylglyceryl transferase [Deltaproteobacteria bacterium RIFCSPLOWO2_12_FULL_38_8]
MYPILLKIPFGADSYIPIPGYGTMLAIGFSLALYLVVRRAKTEGLDPEHFLNVATYIILAALIGSRLFHVFFEKPSYYFSNPLEIPKVWKGGYTFLGGFIPAAIVLWWYTKKHKIPILKSMDIFAPYLALGTMFGRLGCFLAGCCHGKICDFVQFPISYVATNPDSFSRPLGIPLYATQLWQASANFLVFLILIWMRKRKKFDGQLLAGYLIFYPIGRGVIEIFRGDEVRGFVISNILYTSQFLGLFMILGGILLWWRARKLPS